MLGRGKKQRQGDTDGTAHDQQPLLRGSEEDLHEPDSNAVLFSVTDEDDDGEYVEASALDAEDESSHPRTGHNVRFREDVQVIGLPLRSTIQSRETGV